MGRWGGSPTHQTEGRIYAQYVLQTTRTPRSACSPGNDDSAARTFSSVSRTGLGAADADGRAGAVPRGHRSHRRLAVVNLKNSGANVFFNSTAPKFAAQAIKQRPMTSVGSQCTFSRAFRRRVQSVLRPAGVDASRGIPERTNT